MTRSVDEHCTLNDCKLFEDYHCLLNQVDEKSDKFYVIQLLTNDERYFVWTRWGRNGTKGQSKLEGPIEQSAAKESFKKKFYDKSKNKWQERNNFVPVNGKYILVNETSEPDNVQQESVAILASLKEEKPSFPDTVVSGINLHCDMLYQIMFCLTTRDVLRCMQVCQTWKMVLSEKYFWKMFIHRRFDLGLKSDIEDQQPLHMWSQPEEMCIYDNMDDCYIFRPFPSVWNCGVVHPFGLKPLSGDVKRLQGFSRSLEILRHMKKEVDALGMLCGSECSYTEAEGDMCFILFPWNEEILPDATALLNGIFHTHPEVLEEYKNTEDKGKRMDKKLYYHLPRDDEEETVHDLDEMPCLNQVFGFVNYDRPKDQENVVRGAEFYAWLQNIMVPTIIVYAGEGKFNPVVVLFLTNLAPGWVGGALGGLIWT